MSRLRDQGGMTIIEVLVAAFVLTVGIMGIVYSFDTSRKLTLASERRTSLAHLAQREIERLQSIPYSELAMASAPAHSTESSNPAYYVDYSSPVKCKEAEKGGCFAWNVEKTAEEEPLVIATKGECTETPVEGCGKISPSPTKRPCELNPVGSCEWTEQNGRLSGDIYDFVTWHTDGESAKKDCGEGCPSENDYKRVTVVVTVNVPSPSTHEATPVRTSTLIANVNAAPKEGTATNPLKKPGTTCGKEEKCVAGISGNARSWFLHDSGAEEDEKAGTVAAPSKSSETHPTVASSQSTSCTSSNHSGCPKPDLMDEGAPKTTALYDYSTDQNASGYTDMLSSGLAAGEPAVTAGYGGRRLESTSAECLAGATKTMSELAAEPNANLRNEMWVTKPLPEKTTLTGAGGLSTYSQSVAGIAGAGTLCLAIYDVPNKIEDLLESSTTPTLIGYTSYATTEWPRWLQNVSFTFEPCVEPCTTTHLVNAAKQAVKGVAIEATHRIGIRLWPSTAPADGLAIAYDTTPETATEKSGYPSLLQLNTE